MAAFDLRLYFANPEDVGENDVTLTHSIEADTLEDAQDIATPLIVARSVGRTVAVATMTPFDNPLRVLSHWDRANGWVKGE